MMYWLVQLQKRGWNLVIDKNLFLLTRLKKNLKVDKGKLHFDASFQDFVHQYFWRQVITFASFIWLKDYNYICKTIFFFMQSFILTFLAEWGDRSQIATIAVRIRNLITYSPPPPKDLLDISAFVIDFMASIFVFVGSLFISSVFVLYILFLMTSNFLLQLATHKNALGVAVGATIGHTICTSVAVVGGSMLASKISQRSVATVGGLLFLGFSLSSYFYPPLWLIQVLIKSYS